jgi:intracellular sulfur oxidation DsrE/DsrF family protein
MRWFTPLTLLLGLLLVQVNHSLAADQLITADSKTLTGYVARINLKKADQVYEALKRAEAYFQTEQQSDAQISSAVPPIAFVIYGPDVGIFFRENYSAFKPIVDLAARLSALEVIDIKVCQVSYEKEGLDKSTLLPFVTTVPFGPAEITRLLEDQQYDLF